MVDLSIYYEYMCDDDVFIKKCSKRHKHVHVDKVRLCLLSAATDRPIVHPPDDV
jgi:hypothetical protein